MPSKLTPPGGRPWGNKFWLVRGSLDGRRVEVSTKTTDKAAARKFAKDFERQILASDPPRPGEALSFSEAAELYIAARNPGKDGLRYIAGLNLVLGKEPIASIRQAQLVAAAHQLRPHHKPSTRNREVMRPAAAILHYAAANDYCRWLRIELFKETRT